MTFGYGSLRNFCSIIFKSLVISCLCFACQAPSHPIPSSAAKLQKKGCVPVEIQLSFHQQALWSILVPSSWQKELHPSFAFFGEWKPLATWQYGPSDIHLKISLWTRPAFNHLALDVEMEKIEKDLGATGWPTFSHGITQNGYIGIEACRVEGANNWRWVLLAPDSELVKQAPIAAMHQPLLFLVTYPDSETLYEHEAIFEAVYTSLQTLRAFSP